MSVTLAPRARIAVNASWPGVSRKTTRRSSLTISLAPMCCVMPPRSPAATSVVRIASRRLVLPWSTWPMTVTMGARGCSLEGSSSSHSRSFAASAGATSPVSSPASAGLGSAISKPSSPVTRAAVSRSIAWLMLAKMPLLISSRMTSAGFTPSRSASSFTVRAAGISTGARSRGSATCTGPWASVSGRR